jgi:hypothetical protein
MQTIKIIRMVPGAAALCMLALSGVAPVPALAGTAHRSEVHASSHKSKKPKKKKGSSPLVHCASVALRCHTHPGPQGPPGAAGAPGAPGANGTTGHAVEFRITSTSSAFPVSTTATAVPLGGASWTQPAGETELLMGEVGLQMPSGVCNKGEEGRFTGKFLLDGEVIGMVAIGSETEKYTSGFALTLGAIWSGPEKVETIEAALAGDDWFIQSPAASIGHLLSFVAEDNCTDAGASHFVVTSVQLDVIRGI